MSYEINPTKTFLIEAKKLRKRYRSFENDLEDFKESLQENPYQGTELCPDIRKIRMTIDSKGRGKSGCARVITANAIIAEHEGHIALLTIYDKSDASNIKLNVVKQMARDLGFDV